MAKPSVCPSHAGTVPKRMKIGSCDFYCEVAKTLQQWLGDAESNVEISGTSETV